MGLLQIFQLHFIVKYEDKDHLEVKNLPILALQNSSNTCARFATVV